MPKIRDTRQLRTARFAITNQWKRMSLDAADAPGPLFLFCFLQIKLSREPVKYTQNRRNTPVESRKGRHNSPTLVAQQLAGRACNGYYLRKKI